MTDATDFPSGMSNCSDFTLRKEDHTLGNLLSEYLKQAPHVLMAGYKSEVDWLASMPQIKYFSLTTSNAKQSATLMCRRSLSESRQMGPNLLARPSSKFASSS